MGHVRNQHGASSWAFGVLLHTIKHPGRWALTNQAGAIILQLVATLSVKQTEDTTTYVLRAAYHL
jgi:hypothetical protein